MIQSLSNVRCPYFVIVLVLTRFDTFLCEGVDNRSNQENYVFRPCEEEPDTINRWYTAFLLIVVLVNLTGNGLVSIVIWCSPLLRGQVTNIFIFSLAMTDVMMGIFSVPVKINQSVHNQFFCMPASVCWFHYFTDTMFSIASVTHLFVLAVDRFIAVRFTYMYETALSKRKVYFVITCIWLYSLAWTCLNIFDWSDTGRFGVQYEAAHSVCVTTNKLFFTTIYVVIFLVPILAMLFMYTFVYKTAVRHIRAISACEVREGNCQKVQRRRKREFKALRAIVVVFGTFSICWVPNIGVALSGFWDLPFWTHMYLKNHDLFIAIFFITSQILPPLNSTLNPFIYAIFNKQFRAGYKVAVARLLGHKRSFGNRRSSELSSSIKNTRQRKTGNVYTTSYITQLEMQNISRETEQTSNI